MKRPAAQIEAEQRALFQLFSAIVAGDERESARLLDEAPQLVSTALRMGATRADASTHFFTEIQHYAYAGDTALHVAAAAYRHDSVCALIKKRADVRARNRRGAEPLHYACDGIPGTPSWNPSAQSRTIQVLIAAGADPNALDKSGVAALHRAVRTRCSGAVESLLSHGADARLRNKSGSTPLHLAVLDTGRSGSGDSLARDEQARIIALLLATGAHPTDRDLAGRTAAAVARADWIHALLKGSAEPT